MKKGLPAGEAGFTLIESLIVFGLIVTIMGVGFVNYNSYYGRHTLKADALKVKSVLDEAFLKSVQAKSFDTESPFFFGVCFENNSYTLFATHADWDSRDGRFSQYYNLSEGVAFSSLILPANCAGGLANAVLFEPVSGFLDSGGVLDITNTDTVVSLDIFRSGVVEIQD